MSTTTPLAVPSTHGSVCTVWVDVVWFIRSVASVVCTVRAFRTSCACDLIWFSMFSAHETWHVAVLVRNLEQRVLIAIFISHPPTASGDRRTRWTSTAASREKNVEPYLHRHDTWVPRQCTLRRGGRDQYCYCWFRLEPRNSVQKRNDWTCWSWWLTLVRRHCSAPKCFWLSLQCEESCCVTWAWNRKPSVSILAMQSSTQLVLAHEMYTDTFHTSCFSCTVRMLNDVYHTTWLKCLHERVISYSWSSMMSGWLIVWSLSVPRFVPFRVSPSPCSSLPTSCSVLNLFFHVDNAKANITCASANRGVLLSGRIHSSHRLWAQAPWRLPQLGDYWNDLPGGIGRQRNGALVLVWRGSRRWDHRESALLTTVRSGAKRISGPKTSL